MDASTTLGAAQLAYLASTPLGRLATVADDGAPQNNPVGFRWNAATSTVDVHGIDLGRTRKYRNVRHHPAVSLVVDDIASVSPWRVRGVEIRGEAETVDGEVIRIHPRRVLSWGLDVAPGSGASAETGGTQAPGALPAPDVAPGPDAA